MSGGFCGQVGQEAERSRMASLGTVRFPVPVGGSPRHCGAVLSCIGGAQIRGQLLDLSFVSKPAGRTPCHRFRTLQSSDHSGLNIR